MSEKMYGSRATSIDRTIQSGCPSPTVASKKLARFIIKPGLPCRIRRVAETKWRTHTTTKENGFERFERYRNGNYEFRHRGFILQINARHVTHREDLYGPGE